MQTKIIRLFFSTSVLIFACMSCALFSEPELVFSPDSLPEAQLGIPYDVEIKIAENTTPAGDFYISEGALPKGLVLEFNLEDKARIHGVPEESGIFNFNVAVWCYGTNTSGQTGEKEYIITVK